MARDPEVDVVFIAAANALHLPVVEAFASAGKHILCEKPVGRTPEETARAEKAVADAGISSAVGYNYRWSPMVQEVKRLIESGSLGTITHYRGRFFSGYGANPDQPMEWRYSAEGGGHGAASDLLSHAVDLAHFLVGGLSKVVGYTSTTIHERPTGKIRDGRIDSADHGGARTAPVTNEDSAAMLCAFETGASGTFEASRVLVGPESQMAFEVYGTEGSVAWNLESLNELRLYLRSDGRHAGFRKVLGGERFGHHGYFAHGSGIGPGFEDLILIQDFEFLRAVVDETLFQPNFRDAARFGNVQAALLRSVSSGHWEPVTPVGVNK